MFDGGEKRVVSSGMMEWKVSLVKYQKVYGTEGIVSR